MCVLVGVFVRVFACVCVSACVCLCGCVGGRAGVRVCVRACGWMGMCVRGWVGVCASKAQPGLPRHTHTRARACKVVCTLERPKRPGPRRWAGRSSARRDATAGRAESDAIRTCGSLPRVARRGVAATGPRSKGYEKPPGPSGSCRPDNAAAAAAQAQQCSSCLFACPRGLPGLLGQGQGKKSLIVW